MELKQNKIVVENYNKGLKLDFQVLKGSTERVVKVNNRLIEITTREYEHRDLNIVGAYKPKVVEIFNDGVIEKHLFFNTKEELCSFCLDNFSTDDVYFENKSTVNFRISEVLARPIIR